MKNKTKITLAFAILWLLLSLIPWQAWLSTVPVLRLIIGLIIFILPGGLAFLSISDEKNVSVKVLLVGFLVSTFATGLLGVIARLLHLNISFIHGGFIVFGVAAFVAFHACCEKVTWQVEKFTPIDVASVLLAAAGIVYFMSISNPPLIHDDAFTYNALLYYFQHAPVLDFVFPSALSRLEIPRFWIAYWPLVEAMISDFSRVDGLIVAGAYLPPALACFSFIGIFSLGRTLGLPRPAAGAAILAQGFSLMRLSQINQPGNLFFQRLTEDKVAAAFVISPIVLLLIVEYLERPTVRKLILVGISALALVFTHPVQFGMTCMIAGVYGLPSLFDRNIRGKYFALIGVLAAIVLIPYLFRFGGGEYSQSLSFSIQDVAKNDEFGRLGGRVNIIEGTQFYGISRSITPGLPYKIGWVSALLCLFFFYKHKFARYILAAFLVLGLGVFPYTGWLLGTFTTPFQLWRLTWLMPFGLAFAFLIWLGLEMLSKLAVIRSWERWFPSLYYFSSYIGLIALLVFVRSWALGNIESRDLNEVEIYVNYIFMADYMNSMDVDSPVIVGGPDLVTNSMVPSMTLKFEPLFFRVEVTGTKRRQFWESMVGEGNVSVEDRMMAFQENNVEYLLLKGKPDWLAQFANRYPEKISLVFQKDRLSLYQITP